MRVLITGLGFVGSYMARAYAAAGHEVIGVQRGVKAAEYPDCRVLDHNLLQPLEVEPVDVVVQTIAVHGASRKKSEIVDYINSNVIANATVLDYAMRTKPKLFVYLSTVTVLGAIEVKELLETTPLNNPNIYGASKFLAESMFHEAKPDFPVVIVRLPGVVGPGYLVPWLGRVLTSAKKNEEIKIYNPDAMFNNVVHVSEVGRLVEHLANRNLSGVEVLNLGADQPIPLKDVVDLVIKGCASQSKVIAENKGSSFVIGLSKIKHQFGFEPMTTRESIQRYIREN